VDDAEPGPLSRGKAGLLQQLALRRLELRLAGLQLARPHLETAKRELLEETGYSAAEWRRLGVIHTAIAYTNEGIDLFLARKLTKTERKLDVGEFLETLIVDFAEALRMIRDGRITDAKTVAALLWVEKFS